MTSNDKPDYVLGGFNWYVEQTTEGFVTRPCVTRDAARVLVRIINSLLNKRRGRMIPPDIALDLLADKMPVETPKGWAVLRPWPATDECILRGPSGLLLYEIFDSADEAADAARDRQNACDEQSAIGKRQ